MHDLDYIKAALKEANRLTRDILDSLDGIGELDEERVKSEDWYEFMLGLSMSTGDLRSLFRSMW